MPDAVTPPTSPTAPELPDVHARPDPRGLFLPEVGVRGLLARLTLVDPQEAHGPVSVRLSMGVALAGERRGAHLSRFGEATLAFGERLTLAELPERAFELAQRFESSAAVIRGSFPLVVLRRAPVSGAAGLMELLAGFEARADGAERSLRQSLRVAVQTLCPCSKEISTGGAHNQRCHVEATVRSEWGVPYRALLEAVEGAASCPLFPALKRPDEKWVTEHAYGKPAFVEDLVRDAALALGRLPGARGHRLEAESEESIHPHDAYAIAERDP
ncbi:MAG: GTP cyclohydrolase, FolE2/MptA family [Deltaproteobacteria bacterium]